MHGPIRLCSQPASSISVTCLTLTFDIPLGLILTISCHIGVSLKRSTSPFHTEPAVHTAHYPSVAKNVFFVVRLIQILVLLLPSCVRAGGKFFNNSCLSFLIYKMGLVILLSSLGY